MINRAFTKVPTFYQFTGVVNTEEGYSYIFYGYTG
jgi:hypothetical protein